MKNDADTKRPYRQTTRAAASEATAARIVQAFRGRLQTLWFDEIRLEDVAREADVTVQTVIRRFGGKEGLLDATVDVLAREIMELRRTAPGDPAAAVRALVDDYEVSGDLVMRVLAQEERYPTLRRVTKIGRAGHRDWLAETFARWLETLSPTAAQRRLDALVAATDVYLWKLVRRDMQRPVDDYAALVERFVHAALTSADDTR
ncbi:MAG: TetR/AcrR family transcriptional regulator [Caulobacterales bacterium]|nr:TetR/AcrR family transcriptional regulator [Caulobacterales bacterium]